MTKWFLVEFAVLWTFYAFFAIPRPTLDVRPMFQFWHQDTINVTVTLKVRYPERSGYICWGYENADMKRESCADVEPRFSGFEQPYLVWSPGHYEAFFKYYKDPADSVPLYTLRRPFTISDE
jgi:hypothetical protein